MGEEESMPKQFTHRRTGLRLCLLLCLSVGFALASCTTTSTQTPTRAACQTPTQWQGKLDSVDMLSAHDGWAVGDAIFHYDGARWCRVSDTPSASLHSVSMVTPHDGWAVGSLPQRFVGVLLYYNGVRWQSEPLPSGIGELTRVDMLTMADGWAIGGARGAPGMPPPAAVVLHYDGTAWKPVPVPPDTLMLRDISMTSATDGWAVGDDSASHALLLHYDGTRWQRVPLPASVGYLNAISMASPTFGWAGGDVLLRYDGAQWSIVGLPHSFTAPIKALATLSPAESWAVCDYALLRDVGTGSGGTWTVQSTQDHLVGLSLTSPHDGWAVGTLADPTHAVPIFHPLLLHYDGSHWGQ